MTSSSASYSMSLFAAGRSNLESQNHHDNVKAMSTSTWLQNTSFRPAESNTATGNMKKSGTLFVLYGTLSIPDMQHTPLIM